MQRTALKLFCLLFYVAACDVSKPTDYANKIDDLIIKDQAKTFARLLNWQRVKGDTLFLTDAFGSLLFVELNRGQEVYLKKIEGFQMNKDDRRLHGLNFDFPHLSIKGAEIRVDSSDKEDSIYRIPLSDTNAIEALAVMSYYGAWPGGANDSLLVLPLVVRFKDYDLDEARIASCANVCLVDIKNGHTHYPFSFDPPITVNPFLEHPILAYSENSLYYTRAFRNQIWAYDFLSGDSRSIRLNSIHFSAEEFDVNYLGDQEYRLKYYQQSSFATGLWLDEKSNVLVRRSKLSKALKDAEGLNIPPYWADMLFEIIAIESGEIIKTLRIDGKRYDNRNCFIANSKLYIKDEESTSDKAITYGVFALR
tara:strand:+ start:357 stop:1451 length:1095 start_codon:yes stop_codon:yes gene_type:complete